MIHIGLFEGIGGFSIAAKEMGWQTGVTCEIESFPQNVLKKKFPNAYHHGDIHTLNYDTINTELSKRFGSDWRKHGLISTGGFPCQSFSVAGARKGTEDSRYLWPEMFRLIKEIRPDYIIGENVPGLLSIEGGVVFEQVCLDLESEGYEVQAFVLPACATGAPHRRDRVWIVAYSNEVRRGSGFGSIPKANGEISERYENAESCNAGTGNDSNSSNTRVKGLRQERQNQIHGLEPTPKTQQIVHRSEDGVEWANSNIKKKRLERGEEIRNIKRIGQESYEQYKRLYDGNCWANWPSISPFHSGHDGLSEELVRHIRTTLSEAGQTPEQIEAYLRKESSWLRKEAIKCAGNAIVPQVVLQVMKAIQNHYEQYGK